MNFCMPKHMKILQTGPKALISTSLTSNQPLKDNTSNSASMASPILSKLNRRGFALKIKHKYIISNTIVSHVQTFDAFIYHTLGTSIDG